MSVSHGTHARYCNGCRCAPCTKGHTEYTRGHRENDRAWLAEVKEWAYGLGFQLTGRARKPLIERYNREHPDRPYLTDASDKVGHGACAL